ncbi:Uncharacterised protein [Candidatus Anstonella stagnisolia]|nr:Uncharacterised protein [Candidatus Anstonella stagnisolia]
MPFSGPLTYAENRQLWAFSERVISVLPITIFVETDSVSHMAGKIALPLLLFAILLIAGCASQVGAQGSPNSPPAANAPAQKAQPPQAPAPQQTYACPDGTVVVNLSNCPKMKCSDGTWYGACSLDKPKFCDNGELIDNAPACGCNAGYDAQNNSCIVHQAQTQPAQNQAPTPATAPNISCTSQPTDSAHMDIFDSHVHMTSKVSASQMISEMDKAGVSVSNLYSGSSGVLSQYPGRFITFVDTPDSPQPSTWLTQGNAFAASAQAQLNTGKYYGIGEANLRYYSGDIVSPPTIYVPADTPLWLSLVDLSAKYHVPISFHFVPDDPVANVAFEKMLGHNKNAILIWAHLGFNNMPLNSTALNDFLLRYPNLYFDTAGIQNMQNPLPQPNSNWALLANGSNNGKSNEEWRQFFETWNSRILFGSDAGGGSNGKERWLNYAGDSVQGAPPNAVGHWKSLLSNLDYNSARNILSGNARTLFLKEQKPPYTYSVASDGNCYPISVSSNSSISMLAFDQSTRTITFTAADSIGTAGSATITIPAALASGNFTALVDGKSVQIKKESNTAYTTLSLEYEGGIKSITIRAPGSASN